MDSVEIDCEVFRVVRANADKAKAGSGQRAILRAIKRHLPECSDSELRESLARLSGRATQKQEISK